MHQQYCSMLHAAYHSSISSHNTIHMHKHMIKVLTATTVTNKSGVTGRKYIWRCPYLFGEILLCNCEKRFEALFPKRDLELESDFLVFTGPLSSLDNPRPRLDIDDRRLFASVLLGAIWRLTSEAPEGTDFSFILMFPDPVSCVCCVPPPPSPRGLSAVCFVSATTLCLSSTLDFFTALRVSWKAKTR